MGPKNRHKKSFIRSDEVDEVLDAIDNSAQKYVSKLKELIGIYSSPLITDKSGSSPKLMAMKKAVDILRSIGAEVEECYEITSDAANLGDVPVVLGSVGRRPGKSSVLVYCQMDGTGQDGDSASSAKFVRGRAVTDAASFLLWIDMILAHKEANIPLPYNIKFCLDAHSRSEVTQLIFVLLRRSSFITDVEFCVSCSNHSMAGKTPEIVYGYRGICDFFIKLTKGSDDLQTDNTDILLDMLYLLNSLMNTDGTIAIDEFYKDVDKVTEEQRTWFSTINFSCDKLSYHFSAKDSSAQDKVEHIEKLWCEPALIMKGVHQRGKDVKEVTCGFSILTVPRQEPQVVRSLVLAHLTTRWKQISSSNSVEFGMDYWSWPWRADQTDLKYRALADSIYLISGEWPQAVLSGGHLPFPAILRKITGKNVLIFTMGSFFDFPLTKEERLSVNDFINGIKVATRMLHYVERIYVSSVDSKAKATKR